MVSRTSPVAIYPFYARAELRHATLTHTKSILDIRNVTETNTHIRDAKISLVILLIISMSFTGSLMYANTISCWFMITTVKRQPTKNPPTTTASTTTEYIEIETRSIHVRIRSSCYSFGLHRRKLMLISRIHLFHFLSIHFASSENDLLPLLFHTRLQHFSSDHLYARTVIALLRI